MRAVQRRPIHVVQIDLRHVHPPRQRQREFRGQVDNIRDIRTVVPRRGADPHRRDGTVRLVDDNAGSHELPTGRQPPDRGACRQHRSAAVEADAGYDLVMHPKQGAIVRDLQRRAVTVGVHGLIVELRIGPAVQEIRNRSAIPSGQHRAIVTAQEPAAGLGVRGVAVTNPLRESAGIHQPLQ